MAIAASTVITGVGVGAAVVAGVVGFLNYRRSVQWKRAELANSYLKDFNSNAELVFAGRCLDWFAGKLALPENLRAYMPDDAKVIQHDRAIFAQALDPFLSTDGLNDDPRIQIYRTAVDSFLSWLCLVSSALDRGLFQAADIEEVGYWVAKIQSEEVLHGFIVAFGYQGGIERLVASIRRNKGAYQKWAFPPSTLADAHRTSAKRRISPSPELSSQPTQSGER
jgi:hypothetical protein